MTAEIPAPEGALAEAANKALAAYTHHESNKQAGLGVVSGPALHAAMDTLRAALAAQPQQEAWAGAGAFIQHVQVAAGLAGATGHWPDEFLAWYQPEKWLGEHRGAAVFLGQKFATQAPAEGDSWPCPKCGVERSHFPACAQDGCQLMLNGLTEAETNETASVKGLIGQPQPKGTEP